MFGRVGSLLVNIEVVVILCCLRTRRCCRSLLLLALTLLTLFIYFALLVPCKSFTGIRDFKLRNKHLTYKTQQNCNKVIVGFLPLAITRLVTMLVILTMKIVEDSWRNIN